MDKRKSTCYFHLFKFMIYKYFFWLYSCWNGNVENIYFVFEGSNILPLSKKEIIIGQSQKSYFSDHNFGKDDSRMKNIEPQSLSFEYVFQKLKTEIKISEVRIKYGKQGGEKYIASNWQYFCTKNQYTNPRGRWKYKLKYWFKLSINILL